MNNLVACISKTFIETRQVGANMANPDGDKNHNNDESSSEDEGIPGANANGLLPDENEDISKAYFLVIFM